MSPTFVFYETRNGYHFRTLESLMQKPFVNEYYYGKPSISGEKTEHKIGKDYKRIRKYNIASNSDLSKGFII